MKLVRLKRSDTKKKDPVVGSAGSRINSELERMDQAVCAAGLVTLSA